MGGEMWRVYECYAACRTCANRGVCTLGSYRRIVRSPHQKVLECVERRVSILRVKFFVNRTEN